MKDLNKVEDIVISIVKESLLRIPDDLSSSTNLVRSGVLDSLGVVEIASRINLDFSIKLKNSDIHPVNFSSISGITSLVLSYSSPIYIADEKS